MIKPRTKGQKGLVNTIDNNVITIVDGPAGSGKTLMSVYCAAISGLKMVLTRPAVDAGERIGFLPGDRESKMEPYLQPLMDSVRMMEVQSEVEIAPLSYMRGRTFRNSFIILDEAQNCTPNQMLMFLTRIGTGSKMVIVGDSSQLDIESDGLSDAINRLDGVVGIVRLGEDDIIRHPILKRIIKAYD